MTNARTLRVCLVGLGAMSRNHLAGSAALRASGFGNLEYSAVCDIRPDAADAAATLIEESTGHRPRVHTDLEAVLADDEVEAVDVVTDIGAHRDVVIASLEAGKHVLCEKPIALTVRSALDMVAAAERNDRVLAVAENYRRTRWSRIAKAALEAGVIGEPALFVQHYYGGSDRVMQHPWRHLKERGGAAVDMAVHFTDLIRYFLGEFAWMSGEGFISEPVRHGVDATGSPFSMEATGADSLIASYGMASGARASVSWVASGRGRTAHYSALWGRDGSITLPPFTLAQRRDELDSDVTVHLAGRDWVGDEILELLPGQAQPEVEQAILRQSSGLDDETRDRAAVLIGIELHDFARAVLEGGRPEVDGLDGAVSLAAVLGVLESDLQGGRRLALDEVLSGRSAGYQAGIERSAS